MKTNIDKDAPVSRSLETLDELAAQILKATIEKLKKSEIGVKKGHDPEGIHDMRVAARRIRAALKVFNRILPDKVKKIRTELQKLFRLLGKKRDLDVFLAFILHSLKSKSNSYPKLAAQIDKSQKQILAKLKSKYFEEMMGELEKLNTIPSEQNVLKESIKRIRKALKRVLEISPAFDANVDDMTLHKLRISVKKLRYTCEFFKPIFNKYVCSLNSFIEKTIKIQDALGEHQDAIAGISMLIQYEKQFSKEEFLKIQKNYELKKENARKLFFKTWKGFFYGTGFERSRPSKPLELILS